MLCYETCLENQVIVLEWRPKNGIQFATVSPRQIELVHNEYINQNIFFSFISLSMYGENDLFTFQAKNRNTNKQLLINGQKSFVTGLRGFKNMKSRHFSRGQTQSF